MPRAGRVTRVIREEVVPAKYAKQLESLKAEIQSRRVHIRALNTLDGAIAEIDLQKRRLAEMKTELAGLEEAKRVAAADIDEQYQKLEAAAERFRVLTRNVEAKHEALKADLAERRECVAAAEEEARKSADRSREARLEAAREAASLRDTERRLDTWDRSLGDRAIHLEKVARANEARAKDLDRRDDELSRWAGRLQDARVESDAEIDNLHERGLAIKEAETALAERGKESERIRREAIQLKVTAEQEMIEIGRIRQELQERAAGLDKRARQQGQVDREQTKRETHLIKLKAQQDDERRRLQGVRKSLEKQARMTDAEGSS